MTTPRTITLCAVVVTSIALAVTDANPASAALPTRVTQGDAHAVFESQLTGGSALQNTPAHRVAAPATDDRVPVVMSPISSRPDDPFCVLDWHVVRVLLASDVRGDLSGSTVHISLDGTSLDIVDTAIKPLVHSPGVYTRSFGTVVPPGMPAVGPHTLRAVLNFSDGTTEEDQTTTTVYAADSSACAGGV